MNKNGKIVWSEGMFLSPHHFQQWDNYHDNNFYFHLKTFIPYYWGISNLDINIDTLSNGSFLLESCSCVFPDGLIVSIPGIDQSPVARNIEDVFNPNQEKLNVYLAIPVKRKNWKNCDLEIEKSDARNIRFKREFRNIIDENTGENERQVGFAVKNLKIVFGDEQDSLNDHISIKIAELMQRRSRGFLVNEKYIPPCISIASSPFLMSMLHKLIELLTRQCTVLSKEFRVLSSGRRVFSSAEITNVLLLQLVNSFIPVLSHYYNSEAVHPKQLFSVLAQLAGQLMTFTADSHPENLPKYQHQDLSNCLTTLFNTIERLLQLEAPQKVVELHMERVKESQLCANIEDEQLLRTAKFYTSIVSDIPEQQLITDIPGNLKIGSKENIDLLVSRQLRGVNIVYESSPPDPFTLKKGLLYFALEKQGEIWESIRRDKSIAIHMPERFIRIEIKLLAVKE